MPRRIAAFLFALIPLQAAAQSVAEPDWAEALPPGHNNFVVIGDLAPHLERLLGSDRVRFLASKLPGPEPEQRIGEVLESFRRNQTYVPVSAVLATPPITYEFVGDVGHTFLLGALANAVDDPTEAQSLRRQASQYLMEVEAPQLTLWARFRDAATANQLFALARGSAGSLAAFGVEVEPTRTAVKLHAELGAFAAPNVIQIVLAEYGVTSSWEDPVGEKLARRLAGLSLEVELAHSGDALVLSLGRDRASGGTPPQPMKAIWKGTPDQVFYGQWDTFALHNAMEEILATWSKWEGTPVGEAVAALDEQDLIGDVDYLRQALRRTGLKGAMRLLVNDAITGRLRSYGHSETPTLEEAGAFDLLPRDAGSVQATSCLSLADWMADSLSQFEDRLAQQSLKADAGSKAVQAEMIYHLEETYYRDFARVRRLIYEDSHKAFAPPAVMVLRNGGKIDNARLTFSEQGRSNTVTITDAAIPEFAVIGRVTQRASAAKFTHTLWREILSGFDSLPEGTVLSKKDLGLGVPTAVFLPPKLDESQTKGASFESSGDPVIHVAFVDSWFVLSTSTRLTKSLLEAKEDPSKRYRPPVKKQDGLVGIGSYPPSETADAVRSVGELVLGALGDSPSIRLEGPDLENSRPGPEEVKQLEGLLDLFDASIRSFSRFEWVMRQSGDSRQSDLVIGLAE